MCADPARLELEAPCDVARRKSFRQAGKHIPLPAGQSRPEVRPNLRRAEARIAGMELHDHASDERRRNCRLSLSYLVQRLCQGLEGDVLEEVAHRAGTQCAEEVS